jgi:hypothetical protein
VPLIPKGVSGTTHTILTAIGALLVAYIAPYVCLLPNRRSCKGIFSLLYPRPFRFKIDYVIRQSNKKNILPAAACQSSWFYPSPPISSKQSLQTAKTRLERLFAGISSLFTCVSPRAAKHMERNTFPPLVKTKNTTQSRYAQGHPIRLCPVAHLPVLVPPKR